MMELIIRRLDNGLKEAELATSNGSYCSGEWATPVAAMLDLRRKLFSCGFKSMSPEIDCINYNIKEFTKE